MSKTNFLEDKIINHVLRNTAYTQPTTVYVALFTTATDETGAGTEVTGGSYARQSVAFDAPSPAGETQNAAQITFPVATGSWGTVTHFAIMDAVSAGNMLYQAALAVSKVVGIGDQLIFADGALQIDET